MGCSLNWAPSSLPVGKIITKAAALCNTIGLEGYHIAFIFLYLKREMY